MAVPFTSSILTQQSSVQFISAQFSHEGQDRRNGHVPAPVLLLTFG